VNLIFVAVEVGIGGMPKDMDTIDFLFVAKAGEFLGGIREWCRSDLI
jgi:hypothetical protein